MSEGAIITLLVAGTLLWMIGGTYWRPARWLTWPIFAGLGLAHAQIAITITVLSTLALIGVNTLPYGDHSSRLVRLGVFVSYGLPSLLIHPSWWALLPGLVAVVTTRLSAAHNEFTRKIVEGAIGFAQAAAIIIAALAA